MNKKLFILNVAMLIGVFSLTQTVAHQKHYYCTAVDSNYFPRVINLIGSIHAIDFDNLVEIAVFDLGMTQVQIKQLKSIQKVTVNNVDMVHPDLLKPFVTNTKGRKVRGWFAWKPVVIKQALDMFPYVVYTDAGTTILGPTDDLFKHIQQNGYFLINTGHNIEERITKPVIESIVSKLSPEDQKILMDKNTMEIDGGFQGLSRALYEDYVLPMYKIASHLDLFADDGSARLGYGAGRHDQILFSIFANTLKLKFDPQGWMTLNVDGKNVPLYLHWDPKKINKQTTIYRSRTNLDLARFATCIRYR